MAARPEGTVTPWLRRSSFSSQFGNRQGDVLFFIDPIKSLGVLGCGYATINFAPAIAIYSRTRQGKLRSKDQFPVFQRPPHKETDDGADHRDAEVRCQDVPRGQVRAVNL
jgi:hypothetical protein